MADWEKLYVIFATMPVMATLTKLTVSRIWVTSCFLLSSIACSPYSRRTSTSFGCAMMDHIRSFFKKEELSARYICETADYLTQLRLCEAGETAFFCPESYLMQKDFREAMDRQGEGRVMAVEVEGMENRIHVELICRKEDYMPQYMKEFGKILAEEYRNKRKETELWN